MVYSLEFYQKSNGKIPVQEFLDELGKKNKKLRASIFQDLILLESFGRSLAMPTVRYMSDGLYELRSNSGSDIARIFYFFYSGERIILTNGFIKKTQKTPVKELEKARKYKSEFEAQK